MAIQRTLSFQKRQSTKAREDSGEKKPTRTEEILEEKKKFLQQLADDITNTQSFEGVVERFARLGNPATGRGYRGMNNLWLNMYVRMNGYKDPRFLTFNQAKEYGLKLRKGEKSTLVVYCGKEKKHLKPEELEEKRPFLTDYEIENQCQMVQVTKRFFVFNGEQFENMPPVRQEEYTDERREAIIADVKKNLQKEVKFRTTGEGQAYYEPLEDRITLPESKIFRNSESEARTLFHEIAHSTKAEDRTGRSKLKLSYAEEECVAEMASGILYKELGFKDVKEDDYTRNYVVGWSSDPSNPLSSLKEHPERLTKYINLAEQAADYIREHYISKELLLEIEKFPPIEKEKEQKKEVVKNKLTETRDVSLTESTVKYLRNKKMVQEAIDAVQERKGIGKPLDPMEVKKEILYLGLKDEGITREDIEIAAAVGEKHFGKVPEIIRSAVRDTAEEWKSFVNDFKAERFSETRTLYTFPTDHLMKVHEALNHFPDYRGSSPKDVYQDFKRKDNTYSFTADSSDTPEKALFTRQEAADICHKQMRETHIKKAVRNLKQERSRSVKKTMERGA